MALSWSSGSLMSRSSASLAMKAARSPLARYSNLGPLGSRMHIAVYGVVLGDGECGPMATSSFVNSASGPLYRDDDIHAIPLSLMSLANRHMYLSMSMFLCFISIVVVSGWKSVVVTVVAAHCHELG